jgi:hypothetical protein
MRARLNLLGAPLELSADGPEGKKSLESHGTTTLSKTWLFDLPRNVRVDSENDLLKQIHSLAVTNGKEAMEQVEGSVYFELQYPNQCQVNGEWLGSLCVCELNNLAHSNKKEVRLHRDFQWCQELHESMLDSMRRQSLQVPSNLPITLPSYQDTLPYFVYLLANAHSPQALNKGLKRLQLKPFPVWKSDVVVHFRCGDVLRYPDTDYGIPAFSWYKEIVKERTKVVRVTRVIIVGNYNSEKSGQVTLDKPYSRACTEILESFVSYLKRETHVKKVILGAQGAVEDFATLVNAPLMIASVSSFSLWAAVLNKHEVILPQADLYFAGCRPKLPGE